MKFLYAKFSGSIFKVLLVSYCLASSYLLDLLLPYEPSRTPRSSDTSLLTIPQVNTKTHGEAAFQYYAPHLWNNLLENLRDTQHVGMFKNRL